MANPVTGHVVAELVFFASIREALDCDRLTLDLKDGTPLAELIDVLAVEKGENWREALTAENVRVAVNQELVKGNPRVNPGDEIAFFPPVTGG